MRAAAARALRLPTPVSMMITLPPACTTQSWIVTISRSMLRRVVIGREPACVRLQHRVALGLVDGRIEKFRRMRRAGILDHAGDARVADAVVMDHGSSIGSVARDGGPRRERLVPGGEPRMAVAPVQARESGNRCSRARRRCAMWPIEKRDDASASASSSSMSTETLVFSFHACMCLIDCCAGGRSTSPRHISMRVEHAVAERMAAQRDEPLGTFLRKQLLAAVQRVEIFADHRRSRRSPCRPPAAGSAAGSADFPSSVRCSARRRRPRCARSRSGRRARIHAPRSSPCAHRASAATSAAACLPVMRVPSCPRKLGTNRGRLAKSWHSPRFRHGRTRAADARNCKIAGSGMPIDKRVSLRRGARWRV